MHNSLAKRAGGAAIAALAFVGAAQAGGFARGTADTDILFEEGNFNMRVGATFVSPTREYTRNGNPALVGTSYTDDYVIPSIAAKLNVTDHLRCAFTMVDNTGGNAKYDFGLNAQPPF